MTNREVVSIIRAELKQITGDDTISNRAVLSVLKSTANLYIKREIDKRRLLEVDSLYTTIPCLKMVQVPLSECCSYKHPCSIRRSEKQIPKVGEGIWGYAVNTVQSMDGSVMFSEGTAKRYTNMLTLKSNPKFYWMQNGYMYVSDPDIEYVMLRAYFEEDIPFDLSACEQDDKNKQECENPLDEPFRCPGYILQNVITTVIQQYANYYMRLKTDETDDDKES